MIFISGLYHDCGGETSFCTPLAGSEGYLKVASVMIIAVNMSGENILIDFCSAAFT